MAVAQENCDTAVSLFDSRPPPLPSPLVVLGGSRCALLQRWNAAIGSGVGDLVGLLCAREPRVELSFGPREWNLVNTYVLRCKLRLPPRAVHPHAVLLAVPPSWES